MERRSEETYMSDNRAELSGSETFLKQLMAIVRRTALAEMASGMAHELNQPLAAIATYAHAGERMLDREEPLVGRALDVFRQISEQALGAGERMQGIRGLFERETASQIRCQMSDLLGELQPTLNSLGHYSGAVVRIGAAAGLPDVRVDRLRIQNVILSLVQNAIDATALLPDGHVIRIDVSTERYTVETGVTDSGGGVAANIADRLFRPFFTTKTQGTGLGLASSRAIIESHEGSVGFQNCSQGGVRFWFRLPVAVD